MSDLKWFCACEAILNCLFSLKTRISHEYSTILLDSVISKMFLKQEEETENVLRAEISDVHYS